MTTRTRVDLPPHVTPPYEVFVNGVAQTEGTDYEAIGSSLFFERKLAQEGKLGLVRWVSMLLGVAGTYRKHDTIDVVYTHAGRRIVASLVPVEDPPAAGRE